MPGMENRNSKRIVITGVSRGLGRAMTFEFIARGHIVAGCARDRTAIKALATEHKSPHSFTVVDVTRDTQVAAWAQAVLADGPPDLVINNAGLINHNRFLWDVPADEFDRVIDVNLKGTANVIRHFVPTMVARRKGVIVNFSSGWGRSTSPEVAPYCATKWGIEGLTQALAQELPRGMAAVPLNPGIIDTDMLRSSFGGSAGSYPRAEEWAKLAVPYILALGPADSGRPLSVIEE
jgi:NAD(P)-dependent dehydrogenase (short-subunit alcohol dehydrogenase family)